MKNPKPLITNHSFVRNLVTACGALVITTLSASANVVNFDDISGSLGGTLHDGNTYASQGILFSSGSSPNSISVGTVFTLGSVTNDFLVFQNTEVVSAPNAASASGPTPSSDPIDLLMNFTTPITSLSLRTDHSVETQDLIRLIALAPTGNPNEFRVIAFVNGFDDATSAPGDTLSLSLADTTVPFSYALFQMTTESETVDDVTYAAVPEPGSALLLGCAGVIGLIRRRRK